MEDIITLKNVSKQFNLEAGFFSKNKQNVYAVNDVSFGIKKGESFGIVGESGCGKTTTAKMIIQMYRQTSGSIFYNSNGTNVEVSSLKNKQLKAYREEVKYIFQDPARSLNPRLSVYKILTSGLRNSSLWQGKSNSIELASKIIQEVGLSSEDLWRRPAEFSGGQRQRISIARGLIMNPKILICDEVVSALDVSIQGQIINLLQEVKSLHELSYLFITHDLKVACYFCDRIGVMYRGCLVELSPARDLYKTGVHPYTQLLFEGSDGNFLNNNQEVKSSLSIENGCPFSHRCKHCTQKCKEELPELKQVAENHFVRCFL